MIHRKPTQAEIDKAVTLTEKAGAVEALKPSWREVESAFPNCEARIEGREKVMNYLQDCPTPEEKQRRLMEVEEMLRPFHMADIALGQEVQGQIHKVEMYDRNGNVRYVPDYMEDRVGKKIGSRRTSAARWGKPNLMYRGGRWWKKQGREWVPDE